MSPLAITVKPRWIPTAVGVVLGDGAGVTEGRRRAVHIHHARLTRERGQPAGRIIAEIDLRAGAANGQRRPRHAADGVVLVVDRAAVGPIVIAQTSLPINPFVLS